MVAIIDDDPQIASALSKWIQMRGLRACHHSSAESLLKLIQASQQQLTVHLGFSDDTVFTLVGAVLDLNLPGESGVALAHRLRRLVPDFPLVIVTALRNDERLRYGPPPDGVQCLRKPFDLDALEAALFPAAN
jgi:DNA-binding response OmpR family regulator